MNNLLLHINGFENPYVAHASAGFAASWGKIKVGIRAFESAWDCRTFCKANDITHMATTRVETLKLFDPTVEGSAKNNEGALVTCRTTGLRILLLPSLKQIRATDDGMFRLKHWMQKLKGNSKLFPVKTPPFLWKPVNASTCHQFLSYVEEADLCAIDIETKRENLLIRSISYSFLISSSQRCSTFVIDFEGAKTEKEFNFLLALMRRGNLSKSYKILQNGRYDSSYLLRFNSPMKNYFFDTYHLFHCLYAELPKDLTFLSSWCLEEFRYWKDEAATNNLEYNAKDTFFTLWAFVALAHQCTYPENNYAITNYITHEFPLVFPCIHIAQEGLLVDLEERGRLRAIEVARKEQALASMNKLLGETNFNPGSPKQVVQMQKALGYAKAEGSSAKELDAFAEVNPLYNRVVGNIRNYRQAVKAISNYYDAELLNGIMFYELDPAGTETGRMASKASNFWCGSQIQNQPLYCKSMYVPPEGWLFGCADGSQAESRCTAYISEDQALIRTVETSPDFHCTNASLFFGIPFAQLYNEETSTVLRKDIRTVAKRVNHGANYNMGWYVLSTTMGTAELHRAAKLLNLPSYYGIKQIATALLLSFNNAYPLIKGKYYLEVKDEIRRTGRLVGATGWTRRTFLRPDASKLALNAAVAHPPQSLSVTIVNKAFYETWKWQVFGGGRGKIRVKAQIHDEIFFIHKKGCGEEVGMQVGKFMAEPVTVNGRQMLIPNEPKWDAARWSDLKE